MKELPTRYIEELLRCSNQLRLQIEKLEKSEGKYRVEIILKEIIEKENIKQVVILINKIFNKAGYEDDKYVIEIESRLDVLSEKIKEAVKEGDFSSLRDIEDYLKRCIDDIDEFITIISERTYPFREKDVIELRNFLSSPDVRYVLDHAENFYPIYTSGNIIAVKTVLDSKRLREYNEKRPNILTTLSKFCSINIRTDFLSLEKLDEQFIDSSWDLIEEIIAGYSTESEKLGSTIIGSLVANMELQALFMSNKRLIRIMGRDHREKIGVLLLSIPASTFLNLSEEEAIKNYQRMYKDYGWGLARVWATFNKELNTIEQTYKDLIEFNRKFFGISNIHRYVSFRDKIINISILENNKANLDPNNDKGRPLAVAIYNKYDHNESFSNHDLILNLMSIQQIYRLFVFETDVALTIPDILSNISNRFNTKISLIMLVGHGSQNTIQFGRSSYLKSEDSEIFQQIRSISADQGIIILKACSTGKGDDNIAYAIHKIVQSCTIYAPKKDSRAISIKFKEGTISDIRFDVPTLRLDPIL
jgi:hypothetical protein